MKILLITQWYKPLRAAAANRTSKIAEYLAKEHQVTVICALPSYPTGILPPEYRRKLWTRSLENGVNVLRVWDFPSPNWGFTRRTINHLMFILAASIAILFMKPFNVIIVSSPNFFSGLAGLLGTLLWKSDFIFDVRDLWPDSIYALGYKPIFLVRYILSHLEKFYYRKAKMILVATPRIAKHIEMERVVQSNKIKILLNSVDTNFFRPQKVDRKTYGFTKDDFIVLYVGNYSPVYDLKTVLKAAERLQSKQKIKFLFVGDGETKDSIIAFSREIKLKNIVYLPSQNLNNLVKIIAVSNIGLIPLSNSIFFQNSIPSKTSEYLSCGKPIIASVSADLKKYLETYKAGIVCHGDNIEEYVEAIQKLSGNPKLKQKMGHHARQLALKVFSDVKFSRTLKKIFFEL